MEKWINLYRELKIGKQELQQNIGEDLHNVAHKNSCIVKRSDVVNAIRLFKEGKIGKEVLVEWVNVIWFTDLYTFNDEDADSIISVLEILETMDEETTDVSEDDLTEMITALNSNTEYRPFSV